jgi:MFS family permease
VPSGYIADRIGNKVVVQLSFVAKILALLLLILFFSEPAIYVYEFLFALAMSLNSGADASLIKEQSEGRGTVFQTSWKRYVQALQLTSLISAMVAGVLFNLGNKNNFYVYLCVLFISFIFIWIQKDYNQLNQDVNDQKRFYSEMISSLKKPKILNMILLSGLITSFNGVAYFFYQPLLIENEIQSILLPYLVFFIHIVSTAFAFIFGKVKFSHNKYLFLIVLFLTGANYLLLFIHSYLAILFFIIMQMAVRILYKLYFIPYVVDNASSVNRSTLLSIQNLAGKILLIPFILFGSQIVKRQSSQDFLILIGLTYFMITTIAYLVHTLWKIRITKKAK